LETSPVPPYSPASVKPNLARLVLAGIALLAFGLRAFDFENVFLEDGLIVFAFGDPYYHLRLAEYALAHYPSTLLFDSYVAYPAGATVPWPPLYDLWVAAWAWLAGGTSHALEVVSAWWPPVFGAATTLPVYLIGRRVHGLSCGLGAAFVLAVLPISVNLSRVGYADHHAAVVLLAMTLLALGTTLVQADRRSALNGPDRRSALNGPDRRSARDGLDSSSARDWLRGSSLATVRAALLLTWGGGMLYVAVADVTLVLLAAGLGRRRLLRTEAASLLATSLLIAPFVWQRVEAGAVAVTPLALSWLSVTACIALGVWAGVSSLRARGENPGRRLAECVGIGALAVVALLVLLPSLAEGLLETASLAGKEDIWAAGNPEQRPLLSDPAARTNAIALMGGLAWFVPAMPLLLAALAWRRPERPGLVLVAVWSGFFGALTLGHLRFAHDLAPLSALGLVLLADWAGTRLAERLALPWRSRTLLAVTLAAAVLSPIVPTTYLPKLQSTRRPADQELARRSPEASIARFAQQVRRATPETAGFLEADRSPEYGILSDPSLGHALHYVARRPTLSDNFGPYTGEERFLLGLRLLLTPPTDATVPTLRESGIRYVATNWQPEYRAGSLLLRLHERDGREQETARALDHFRLVTEGPKDGLPLAALLGSPPPRGTVPYKLFEVVEGALLEIETTPGARVSAAVTLETETGRRFVHRVRGRADAEGRGALRVPYATESAGASTVRADGPYRVRAGGVEIPVEVGDADVREGRRITLTINRGSR